MFSGRGDLAQMLDFFGVLLASTYSECCICLMVSIHLFLECSLLAAKVYEVDMSEELTLKHLFAETKDGEKL